MKWGNLSKGKKLLVLTGLGLGCAAAVFASYILKGRVNLGGSVDAEAFPVNIDIGAPDSHIGAIKPFLGIRGSQGTTNDRPFRRKASAKKVIRNTFKDSSGTTLLADNSNDLLAKSGQPSQDPDLLSALETPPSIENEEGSSSMGTTFTTYLGDYEVGAAENQNPSGSGGSASKSGNDEPGDPNQPSPVPEPSTMILLGSGLVGLAVYGKKRVRDLRH